MFTLIMFRYFVLDWSNDYLEMFSPMRGVSRHNLDFCELAGSYYRLPTAAGGSHGGRPQSLPLSPSTPSRSGIDEDNNAVPRPAYRRKTKNIQIWRSTGDREDLASL